ncbi:CDP-alcohol phosphatidyltransferase family protein [Humibacter ginsenosidimutans]|uniref:CDP-alcohol phosphatidyltransferase family protein n=1 Tax=Humibacter ginsenosidimutans TaxID=2599293 RepID=A0A5B8M2X9_9MICO|nr:CDP-alcohol phosphatidyltransferase family protein [Humibacter ginsenosidimutans]QDZ14309.1 CDP-alcohol phosphatidyltransferase family protein [Humibacter ginsenosidimutans]
MSDSYRRPSSIAELREVTQPPEVRQRRNAEHWTAHLYLRAISPYLTWALLKTRISANGVTGFMILSGWCAAAALLIPGIGGAVLAVVFGQLQMLFDCCDGEVARWRHTSSPAGHFLDAVGHYSTETLIAVVLGFRAAGWPFQAPEDYLFTTLGFALALVLVLNKALNDLMRVARAYAGLPRLGNAEADAAPQHRLIALARRAVKFFPFHRMFHSVELTLLTFVVAVIALFTGSPATERVYLPLLLAFAILALIGHFVAIMSSRRLRA